MLLGVVADLQAVTRVHLARVRLLDAAEDAQERRLACTVEAEHDDAAAAVDREVDAREDLLRAVGLGQPARGERRAAARRGLREAQLRDLVAPGARPRCPRASSRRGVIICCAATALVALARIFSPWGEERTRLLLGVLLARDWTTALVGLARAKVGIPAEVVLVEALAAVGVQVEHLVHRRAQQLDVVRDHDEAAAVRLEGVGAARRSSRRRGGSSARRGAASRRRRRGCARARCGGAAPPDSVLSGWPSTRSSKTEVARDAVPPTLSAA